jgi:hypothetical protein
MNMVFPFQDVFSERLPPTNQIQEQETIDSLQINKVYKEVPKELTKEEFQREMEEIKRVPVGHIVLYDLYNPEGIDPNLLPADIAAQVDADTKIIEYFETTRIDSVQTFDKFLPCNPDDQYSILGIPCASPNGTKTLYSGDYLGEVTQWSKVYALRYDNPTWAAQPMRGWELEKQWAQWTRTDSSWYVADARMKVEASQTQDYCSGQILGSFYYSSTTFDPTFYGNATNWYSISGFANRAYVPSPYHLIASTQADIYQSSVRKYNDKMTSQYFSKDP